MPFIVDASVAVALGANQPSAVGLPRDTLLVVQPLLEGLLLDWAAQDLRFHWSTLHDTAPVGGPAGQPHYCNAVVLVEGVKAQPMATAALDLLDALQGLEHRFGRDRSREQRWGPRSLDLDLLFWGELRLEHPRLVLPHPRLHLRDFVLAPLLEAMHGSPSSQSPDRPDPAAQGRGC
ncbi:2-amino-4-hydroxy-6-hydroxymethyldihydropteridine diphosphokinase [Synechococcus sp. MU1625]|uniref:2-amino-4-hydroxy-6- hydroxymethyldihydropteridine diphosphokinase n=1 Tax=Synechococcus sp. MU1625 TaxID=2508347 RepID=UPI001CF8A2B5|nr:2-amino-4-hydroxy-6-hydroxymethyldihydropteridine diphosphokinase [Synechococcus sp. MU1625]MCB4399813.1 2-amino-4-hydroxy-6-hydroxymethyldihydropteridine diphosphokinase [Synechococcus sp. MU1625]